MDQLKYDTSAYDLALVKDDDALPVYRLQPRGLAYRRAREKHHQQVEARRAAKVKQVHFGTTMAAHDFDVHVARVRGFVGEKEWRVRCVVEPAKTGAAGKGRAAVTPMQFAQQVLEAVADTAVIEAPPQEAPNNAVTFMVKPKHKK